MFLNVHFYRQKLIQQGYKSPRIYRIKEKIHIWTTVQQYSVHKEKYNNNEQQNPQLSPLEPHNSEGNLMQMVRHHLFKANKNFELQLNPFSKLVRR